MGIRYSGGRAVSEDGRSYTSSGGRTSKVVVMGKEYTVDISEASNLTGRGVTGGLVGAVQQQKQAEAQQKAAEAAILKQQETTQVSSQSSMDIPSPVPKSFSQDIKPVFQYGEQSRGYTSIPTTPTPSSFDASVSKPVYQFGEQSRGYIAAPVTDSKTSSKTTPISTGFEPSGISEGMVTSTYKKGDQRIIIDEPAKFSRDPSSLSTYERLDLNLFSGYLPGGVSKEFVADFRSKEKLFASEKELKLIRNRDIARKVGTPALLIGGTVLGLGAVGVSTVGIGGSILKGGFIGVKAAIAHPLITGTGIVTTTTAGLGVYETTQAITKAQATPFQKELLAERKEDINKAIQAGKFAVSEKRKEYSITQPEPIKKVSLWIGGVREETFRSASRKSLEEAGFKGGKLDEAVALTEQLKTSQRLGEIAAIVGISAGSESLGRALTKPIIPKTVPKIGSAIFKNVVIKATQSIGIAGAAEGFSTDVILTRSGTLPVNPLRTLAVTFGGAFTAGGIGGTIVEQSLISKGRGSAFLGGAYATDPSEPFGDVLADIGEKLSGITRAGVKTKVSTGAAFVSSAIKGKTDKGFGVNVIPSDGSAPYAVKTRVVSSVPPGAKSIPFTYDIPSPVGGGVTDIVGTGKRLAPTKTYNIISSRGRGGSVANIISGSTTVPIKRQASSLINLKTNIEIPGITNVPSIIDTNTYISTQTNINNIVTTPTSITSFSYTNVPTAVSVPVAVPTFGLPLFPFIPPSGGGSFKYKPYKGLVRGTKYQASIGASEKIFVKAFGKSAATKKSPFVTGVEIRL